MVYYRKPLITKLRSWDYGIFGKFDFFRTEIWYPNLSKNVGHWKLAKNHPYQRLQTRRASRNNILYASLFFEGIDIYKIRLKSSVIYIRKPCYKQPEILRFWKFLKNRFFSEPRIDTEIKNPFPNSFYDAFGLTKTQETSAVAPLWHAGSFCPRWTAKPKNPVLGVPQASAAPANGFGWFW